MQQNTRQFIFISTQDPSVAGKREDSSAYDPYLTGDGCVWSKGSKVINRFWQLILRTLSSITVCHWSGHLEQEARDAMWCSPRVNSQIPHRRLWQDAQQAQRSTESGFIF